MLTDWDKMSNLYKRTFHRCFLPSFESFGHAVSEEIFRNKPIRNKNRLWWPCLLMDRNRMSNLYRGPSIDASYQVSVHLAMWFQRRSFFRNRPIRKKNCVNTMTCGGSHLGFPIGIKKQKLCRGPSNDHSWAVWFQLSKWFQRRSVLKHFSHRVQC